MNQTQFRELFPALRATVWLDTPAAPPGADPVVQALRDAVSAWSRGEFDPHEWGAATGEARGLFARLAGAEPGTVSAHGSLAEAAATVAASLPGNPGEIVVAAEEFRSNLFPWAALAGDGWRIVTVPARGDRVGELRPLAPNWRSSGPPYGYFGLPMRLAGDAARCDASPAWFSWVGAGAALRLLGSLDAGRVERHCLGLAARFSSQAAALGLTRVTSGPLSQIVVLRTEHAERLAGRLSQRGIRATSLGDRIRFGFHYFNDDHDIDRTVEALSQAGRA